jgi:hypothetical protein
MIDVDDIFRYDEPPAVAMPSMATEPTVKGEPTADYQSDRSRLFLADPDRFFAGWRRIGGAWVAPWYRESRN